MPDDTGPFHVWNEIHELAEQWLAEQADQADEDQTYTAFVSMAEFAIDRAQYNRDLYLGREVPDDGFWLYRLYSQDDRLIYVGVTIHPAARIRCHRRNFGELFHHIKWEECDSRIDMLRREALAIANENPAFNHAHPKVSG